jgi:hypothetical protein
MFVFTQMTERGTSVMFLLGVPFYLTALLIGLSWSHAFPGAYLLVVFGGFLVFSYLYSKALVAFNRLSPRRPGWQFVVGVLVVQLIILAATLYAVAA